MSIAKALFGLIGTAIIGLFVTSVAIPEWTLMNLELHFWQTVWGFLISAAFGGAAVFIIHSAYIGWRLGDNPCGAFDELKGIEQLQGCKSLSDMIDPVKALSANEALIAELKARISDLEDSYRKVPEQIRTPSGKLCANMAAVRTLPVETVQAMLDAFDHGGGMDFGPHEQAVRKSVKNGDGIFVIGRMFFMGYYGEENGSFMLSKEWREFMDDADTLAEIREIVRSAEPVWKTIGE